LKQLSGRKPVEPPLSEWQRFDATQLHQDYLRVFGTEEGKRVLADMLEDLQFWTGAVVTEAQTERSNYARLLLAKIGSWREGTHKRQVEAFLDSAVEREVVTRRQE